MSTISAITLAQIVSENKTKTAAETVETKNESKIMSEGKYDSGD